MDIREKLHEKEVLIADGAWGTELIKKGFPPGECPENLNLEEPGIIREIAESYRRAGADIILTNTFGANRFKLERAGLSDKTEEINRRGVEISRQAAGDAFVFASLGPTGQFIRPLGNISADEMISCFREQIEGFVRGGADGIIIETMSDMEEAKCALAALKDAGSEMTSAVTFTFQKGAGGFATVMGVTPRRMVEELGDSADLIGANCGSGIDGFLELVPHLRELTPGHLWIKPNAGQPVLKGGQIIYGESPAGMAEAAASLAPYGVKVLGGCCGTTPGHIKELRRIFP